MGTSQDLKGRFRRRDSQWTRKGSGLWVLQKEGAHAWLPNSPLGGTRPQEMAVEWIYKPMGQTPLNIQPHKIIVNHTWFQYTSQEILSAGGHQYSFPRRVVHAITHTAITTLLGFPGFQSKKMRPHEVRAGILLGLGPLCPTGDNISCNNSIGIAARVPSRDLASFKSLWSVKHKAMASSQVSSSPSLDTIYHEGHFCQSSSTQ